VALIACFSFKIRFLLLSVYPNRFFLKDAIGMGFLTKIEWLLLNDKNKLRE